VERRLKACAHTEDSQVGPAPWQPVRSGVSVMSVVTSVTGYTGPKTWTNY